MNKNIVILTAEGFQDEEYIYCYFRLTEEDITPVICTPTGQSVIGKYGVPTKGFHISTSQLLPNAAYYLNGDRIPVDGIVIPGGFEAPGRLRHLDKVIEFVRSINELNKPIGALCHGPQVLISADIVRGRPITSYKDCYVDLKNAGADAKYMEPVVVDGNIVSSCHYDYNGIFMKEFIKLLNK